MRHIEPGGIGYTYGYTTLSVLATPYAFSKGYLFLDGRAHLFNNQKFASNVGFGWRFGNQQCVGGFNAYYDFRYEHDSFNQIGFGFDIRGNRFLLSTNGYLNVGNKLHELHRTELVYGDYFAAEEIILNSFKRADVEVGYLVVKNSHCHSYVGIGSYFLQEECRCSPTTWGGMGTIKINVKGWVSVEGIFSYDELFQTNAQIQASFVFPFAKNQTPFLSVSRQEIIPINKRYMWEWNY